MSAEIFFMVGLESSKMGIAHAAATGKLCTYFEGNHVVLRRSAAYHKLPLHSSISFYCILRISLLDG